MEAAQHFQKRFGSFDNSIMATSGSFKSSNSNVNIGSNSSINSSLKTLNRCRICDVLIHKMESHIEYDGHDVHMRCLNHVLWHKLDCGCPCEGLSNLKHYHPYTPSHFETPQSVAGLESSIINNSNSYPSQSQQQGPLSHSGKALATDASSTNDESSNNNNNICKITFLDARYNNSSTQSSHNTAVNGSNVNNNNSNNHPSDDVHKTSSTSFTYPNTPMSSIATSIAVTTNITSKPPPPSYPQQKLPINEPFSTDHTYQFITQLSQTKNIQILRLINSNFILEASRKNQIAILSQYLKIQTDLKVVDVQDEFGRTALIWASQRGHLKSCELLIEYGASLNIQNKFGYTALLLASKRGNSKVVELLINCGADGTIINQEGFTAFEVAKSPEIRKMLMRFHVDKQQLQQSHSQQLQQMQMQSSNGYNSNGNNNGYNAAGSMNMNGGSIGMMNNNNMQQFVSNQQFKIMNGNNSMSNGYISDGNSYSNGNCNNNGNGNYNSGNSQYSNNRINANINQSFNHNNNGNRNGFNQQQHFNVPKPLPPSSTYQNPLYTNPSPPVNALPVSLQQKAQHSTGQSLYELEVPPPYTVSPAMSSYNNNGGNSAGSGISSVGMGSVNNGMTNNSLGYNNNNINNGSSKSGISGYTCSGKTTQFGSTNDLQSNFVSSSKSLYGNNGNNGSGNNNTTTGLLSPSQHLTDMMQNNFNSGSSKSSNVPNNITSNTTYNNNGIANGSGNVNGSGYNNMLGSSNILGGISISPPQNGNIGSMDSLLMQNNFASSSKGSITTNNTNNSTSNNNNNNSNNFISRNYTNGNISPIRSGRSGNDLYSNYTSGKTSFNSASTKSNFSTTIGAFSPNKPTQYPIDSFLMKDSLFYLERQDSEEDNTNHNNTHNTNGGSSFNNNGYSQDYHFKNNDAVNKNTGNNTTTNTAVRIENGYHIEDTNEDDEYNNLSLNIQNLKMLNTVVGGGSDGDESPMLHPFR